MSWWTWMTSSLTTFCRTWNRPMVSRLALNSFKRKRSPLLFSYFHSDIKRRLSSQSTSSQCWRQTPSSMSWSSEVRYGLLFSRVPLPTTSRVGAERVAEGRFLVGRQLPKDHLLQAMLPLINHLQAESTVEHTYAAHALERLFTMRGPNNSTLWGPSAGDADSSKRIFF